MECDNEAVFAPGASGGAGLRGPRSAIVVFVHEPGHGDAEFFGEGGPVRGCAERDLTIDREGGKLLLGRGRSGDEPAPFPGPSALASASSQKARKAVRKPVGIRGHRRPAPPGRSGKKPRAPAEFAL